METTKIISITFMSILGLVSGGVYFDKCYCPEKDPYLNRDPVLRNKMYELRRAYTNSLDIWRRRIVPETGVPSISVLTSMFPDIDANELKSLTLTNYTALVDAKQNAVLERLNALNESFMASSSSAAPTTAPPPTTATTAAPTTTVAPTTTTVAARKKREAEFEEEETVDEDPHELKVKASSRWKRQTTMTELYDAMLLPKNEYYGIHTVGGGLDTAVTCNCGAPASHIRKELKFKVVWEDDMWDPATDAFKDIKNTIEAKSDMAYSASDSLLSLGYAGTTVLAIRLESLGATSSRRRKRQATNTTEAPTTTVETVTTTTAVPTTTTTMKPAIDVIAIVTDIVFGGAPTNTPPMNQVDAVMGTLKSSLGILAAASSTGGNCKFEDLAALGPPGFLTPNVQSEDFIPSGYHVVYNCSASGTMLPFDVDPDSNFELEVYCKDGVFETPLWPASCETLAVCTTVPNAPSETGLARKDDKTTFRAGEKAYFICDDTEAVLDDQTGLNMFAVECPTDISPLDFNPNVTWPNCIVEPVCDSLPDPSSESLLVKATQKDYVLLGETVDYECADKALFYETPTEGHTISILCDNPVTNGKGQLTPRDPWPICAKLPCKCLADGLTIDQSKNVLLNSCPSNETFRQYKDVSGSYYIIPKQVNCGTYKPNNPTYENKCECPEMGEPIVFWNALEVISFVWYEKLEDASTQMFNKRKATTEKELDAFYLDQQWMREFGYIRSVAVRFKSGSAHAQKPGFKYVKVVVEHQFRNDSNITIEDLRASHANLLTATQGKVSDNFALVPTSQIDFNHTCTNESLARLFKPQYVVQGHESSVVIGDSVKVYCVKSVQLFTVDIWDDDPNDNTLSVICRPDTKFDVPATSELPQCLAQCSATKPVPPAENNIALDESKTSPTAKLWEREELWYTCLKRSDGIAILGPNDTYEGSDDRSKIYQCDANGEYDLPTQGGQYVYPKCVPRPKRCQCLGEFKVANYSRNALDLYCRNDTWLVMPGVARNATGHNLLQVVPNKTRCGSLDPVEMIPENKCFCKPKDNYGAAEGFWIKMEIFNIPWTDELLDFASDTFKDAKYVIERALDLAYIDEQTFFNKGFVRTIVMRFFKGHSVLNNKWDQLIKDAANATNATNLDEVPDDFTQGSAIIDIFEPVFEPGKRGVSDTVYYSTMVEFEVQFLEKEDIGLFRDITMTSIITEDWISETLWVNTECFQGPFTACGVNEVRTCLNTGLTLIVSFGFAHSNVDDAGTEKEDVPVGSTVNIYCSNTNERIVKDIWDADPGDYLMTVLCKPNTNFELPLADLPQCKAWCPAIKAKPPNATGLLLSEDDNNNREYWEDETITYVCNDTALGIDASDATAKQFRCKKEFPKGRYTVPRGEEYNETWPVCQTRTTTVKPPIKVAMRDALIKFDELLIKRKTDELYLSERDAGDEDYLVAVTVPCLLFLTIIIMVCLCCTRNDNPLCQYCSRTYVPA